MAKMIQVRNVPDSLHRELVKRARANGQTLTEYIEEILRKETERPDPQELFRRVAAFPRVDLGRPAADIIREERERHERRRGR